MCKELDADAEAAAAAAGGRYGGADDGHGVKGTTTNTDTETTRGFYMNWDTSNRTKLGGYLSKVCFFGVYLSALCRLSDVVLACAPFFTLPSSLAASPVYCTLRHLLPFRVPLITDTTHNTLNTETITQ